MNHEFRPCGVQSGASGYPFTGAALPRLIWIAVTVYALVAVVAVWLVWHSSYGANLDRLAETGQFRVE